MKVVTGLVLLVCSAALCAQGQRAAPERVEIEDADTLLVEVGGVAYRIQLPGIDAPESTLNPKLQRDIERTGLEAGVLLELGRRADEGLRGLLSGFAPYALAFDPDGRDRYGRVPGDLFGAGDRRLSVRLVEAGYAIPVSTADPAQQAALDAALSAARAAQRGLWGSHAGAFSAWAQPAGGG